MPHKTVTRQTYVIAFSFLIPSGSSEITISAQRLICVRGEIIAGFRAPQTSAFFHPIFPTFCTACEIACANRAKSDGPKKDISIKFFFRSPMHFLILWRASDDALQCTHITARFTCLFGPIETLETLFCNSIYLGQNTEKGQIKKAIEQI